VRIFFQPLQAKSLLGDRNSNLLSRRAENLDFVSIAFAWRHYFRGLVTGRAFIHAVALLILFAPLAFAGSTTTITIRGKQQTLYLYGTPGAPPIILSSGDLGWVGLVTHVAEFFSENGYFVIGFNSRSYLASFTTKSSTLSPQDVPHDFMGLITYGQQFSSLKPILSGVSEGAGLSVLAATESTVKNGIAGILSFGLPDQNELGWKWQDFTIWITKKSPDEPSFMVEDIIQQVGPVPLAEIHSTHDEFLPLEKAKAMFALAKEPKKMWVVEAANHRFSNNRQDLDRSILEALSWVKSANK
jgi:hypothetical protein